MKGESQKSAWKPLNVREAEELFHSNAMALGKYDGVPVDVARRILGRDATEYAIDYRKIDRFSNTFEMWGVEEDFAACYLTETGFKIAVTYRNLIAYRASGGENAL